MTEITTSIANNASSPAQTTASKESITLSQTRPFVWEFLLTLSTFSFYSIFYLVVRTHELNKLGEKKFIPWLWLFSLSPVVSLFSLPILHSTLTKLEAEYQSPQNKQWNIATLIVMLLSNTYLSVSSKLLTPFLLDLIILIIWSASFACFAQRITKLKHALPNVSFKPENKLKLIFKWLFALTIIPLFMTVAAVKVFDLYQQRNVQRMDTNTFTAISADQKASIKFFEPGWYQTDIGTWSDGSAEAEFSSQSSSNYLMLFTYSEPMDLLDTHMQDRRDWLEEQLSLTQCTQNKYLTNDQFLVKSDLICTGRVLGEKTIAAVSVIETPNKTYEILAMYGAPNYESGQQRQKFIQMVKEFNVR